MQQLLGLDLLDFFRGRYSWRKLADLVRQLPAHSQTTEAMAEDDELAETLPEPSGKESGPRLSEYTADVARLDILTDRIGELISVVVQVAGGKAPRVRPARRPETAFTRAAAKRRERRITSLIDEVEAAQKRWSAMHVTK